MKTNVFLVKVDNSDIEKTIALRKELTKIYGPLRLRGRHSDRKKVLGNSWRRWSQNDIPWRLGETVSFYLHDSNKNYPGWDWKTRKPKSVKSLAQLYIEYYEKNTGQGIFYKRIII